MGVEGECWEGEVGGEWKLEREEELERVESDLAEGEGGGRG